MKEKRSKILVCDDDQDILDLLEMLLESEGFDYVLVNNSLNIYKQIEQEQPDLILLDIWMPVLSGQQIAQVLKENENTRQIPIIMFSASNDGQKIAKQCGADDYISKPFSIAKLMETINDYIDGVNA